MQPKERSLNILNWHQISDKYRKDQTPHMAGFRTPTKCFFKSKSFPKKPKVAENSETLHLVSPDLMPKWCDLQKSAVSNFMLNRERCYSSRRQRHFESICLQHGCRNLSLKCEDWLQTNWQHSAFSQKVKRKTNWNPDFCWPFWVSLSISGTS